MLTDKTGNRYGLLLLFLGFFLGTGLAVAQQEEILIDYGPTSIAQNEPFQIKLIIKNGSLQRYSAFPDVAGFVKASASTESSTSIYNGRVNREIRLVQSYMPEREGRFRVPQFTMEVNGREVSSPGIVVNVGPPKQRQAQNRPQRPRSLFDELFGADEPAQSNTDFVEIEDHAFLGLTVDKDEVWMGEGFTTTLAFYIPDSEMYLFNFHDLNNQLNSLVQNIKPENCWEEGFQLYDIRRTPVEINGRAYGQYKLYQARYYPLNAQNVEFPVLKLDMVKYKIARRASFFGRSKQESVKTYNSEPLTVRVKDLPPHPLKDAVAVGDYRMQEELTPSELETGSSFTYNFTVLGQGNIAAIIAPEPQSGEDLSLRGPKERSRTRKTGATVVGVKEFSYTGQASEPGEYPLEQYLQWVYFNPRLARYDTLRPTAVLTATGQSLRDRTIAANDPGSFYNQIDLASNTLRSNNQQPWQIWFLNGMLVLLVGGVAFLYFNKKA